MRFRKVPVVRRVSSCAGSSRATDLTLPAIFSATSAVSLRMVETKNILMRVIERVKHCWKRMR